ncbi:choice-of-anchor D domain-containing protein [Myxococcota bacterium]|nr:choice-of-anchor D domain-containing protein [Myxococcota bacterium]
MGSFGLRLQTFSFALAATVLGTACNCGGEGGIQRLFPDIQATPSPLAFGTAYTGLTASRALKIKNAGNVNLDVASIVIEEGSTPGLSVVNETFTLAPSSEREVLVRLESRDAGTVTGAVLIASNDPDSPTLRVPITAEVSRRVGPALAICVESSELGLARTCELPLSVDFGTKPIGSTTRASVILRSIGDEPVTITSAQAAAGSDPSFTFDPASLTEDIAPDTERTITVSLVPASESAMQAVFQVVSNDPERDLVPVIFTANGVRSGLCANPGSLDFGMPVIGQPVVKSVTLSNCGNTAITLGTLLVDGPSSEFSVPPLAAAVPLAPGESHAVDVTYLPTNTGVDNGRLRAIADSGEATVALRGQTAVCDLVVSPASVDFGVVGINQTADRNVVVENVGGAACTMTNAVIGGSSEFAFPTAPTVPQVISSGASVTLTLRYAPGDAGSDTGTLTIASDDPTEARIDVPLAGRRRELGECELTATPDPIAFGVVPVGARRTIGVQITNTGMSSCTILQVGLGASSASSLAAVGGPALPLLLAGRSFNVDVVFEPRTTGPVTGTLEIRTRLGQPPAAFQITGTASGPRLCVTPDPVIFGSHPQGSTIDRQVTLTSCGTDTLTISSLTLPAPTSAEYRFAVSPSTPLSLPAGATHTLDVRYVGANLGRDDGILRILSNDGVEPMRDVALIAATGQSCGDLTARICGLDGMGPVAGATVYVDTPNGRIQTTTDANGDFVLTCLPVGGVMVTAESGSWSTSFNAQIMDQQLTSVPGQQCLNPNSAEVAVVWGEWDQMETVLSAIGVPYTFYGQNDQDDLLLDPNELARYDVVFLNCGFNELAVRSGPGAQYLVDFVANGGSIYASDYAYDAIEQNWPMFIDFMGDDAIPDSAQTGGTFNGLVDVLDASLRAALGGRGQVPIDSRYAAMESAGPGTTIYLEGDRFNDGGRHPFFVSFQPTATSGTVMYTDFHNTGQRDIDSVFRWLINRL